MQVLVDTKFWNLVFKYISPKATMWIKQNKGKSKDKKVKEMCVIKLDEINILSGFYLKNICKPMYTQLLTKLGKTSKPIYQSEIEIGIISAAIVNHGLSSSVLYENKPIITKNGQILAAIVSSKKNSNYGFVYLIRNGDLFKIGITENLLRRFAEIKPDEVLDVLRSANYQEVERKIHSVFKEVRIPQTEYFRLNAEQVQQVHALMLELSSH